MAAMYRLKGLGWLASVAVVAIGFYLVSSQVAAERKRLEQVDRKIVTAERDIRALETEFDVRANLAQLERWNGDTLALTVPVASQFVRDEAALASLSPRSGMPLLPDGGAPVQTAQLIVPTAPVVAAPVLPAAPVQTAAVQTAAAQTASVPAARTVAVTTVKVAAAKPAAAPRLTPAVATAATAPVRSVKAVAMLDKSLLSDSTIGELLSGARAERSRLR